MGAGVRVSFFRLVLVALCSSPSCERVEAARTEPVTRSAAEEPASVVRIDLKLDDVNGLSGLATDGAGAVWTVPERQSLLLRLSSTGIDRRVPVDGVPDGLDLESIAWLGEGRIAFGTEAKTTPRPSDLVLVAEVGRERATVVERLELAYSGLPIQAEKNRGIEGLCHAEDHLLASFEQVVSDKGKRKAVIVHRNPNGKLRTLTVSLTTPTGKISALECRSNAHGLEVIAVERHFGVRRIITFDMPFEKSQQHLDARVVLDLERLLPSESNPEGITWGPGKVLLVVDNHYGERTGPNELLRVAADAFRGAGQSSSGADSRLQAREQR
jgi:hypothetical protein